MHGPEGLVDGFRIDAPLRALLVERQQIAAQRLHDLLGLRQKLGERLLGGLAVPFAHGDVTFRSDTSCPGAPAPRAETVLPGTRWLPVGGPSDDRARVRRWR